MSGFQGTGLQIGSISLTHFEIPNEVPWGTTQELKEFTYPGGKNDIVPMGPRRRPLEWNGQMFGPTATDRARGLDALASAGQPVPVTFGDLSFTVVIEEFQARYKHQWQGHYSIKMKVVWDYQAQDDTDDPTDDTSSDMDDGGDTLDDTSDSLSGMVASIEGTAQSIIGTAAALAGAVQNAAAAVDGAGAAVKALKVGIPLPGAITAAEAGIQGALVQIGATAAQAGGVLTSVAVGPSTLLTLAAAAGASASCAVGWGYTARAALNCQQIVGAGTPSAAPAQTAPDLSNYAGA